MDPDQAVRDIAAAINEREYEAAMDLLDELVAWEKKGGFAPGVQLGVSPR